MANPVLLNKLSSAQVAPSVSACSAHRRHTSFPRSKWSNHFIEAPKNDIDPSRVLHEIGGLKAEVRQNLNALASEPLRLLKMIDAIQLLGLGYHFSEEIEQALESLFADISNTCGYDLYYTSLSFRLLRQHGYDISSDIFNKFITTNGGLIEDLLTDVQGMLSFYEAAQLRLHKDAALDEVVAKCVTHLESIAPNLNPSLNRQVTAALKQSLHKDIPRLRAWKYISAYQKDESHDKTLLKLAKLDFNLLQKYHQQELSHISRWWKDLDLPSKCHYARDRLVEAYIWALTMYYEPQYSLGRMIFTKLIALAAVLDDTYDAYGTIDELELLTEAISRWISFPIQPKHFLPKLPHVVTHCRGDIKLSAKMPTYARALYQSLLGFYDEIEVYLAREGRSYQMPYLKEAMKNLAKSYYEEQVWLKNKYSPTMDEYMLVATTSSGVTTSIIFALAGMGDAVTKTTFDWILSKPRMLTACEVVTRLQDDIVSHKFEQEREHPPSAVECYMSQHGVSESDACKVLSKMVADGWKDMNDGCIKPTAAPIQVLERILNFARLIDVVYKDGDGFTNSKEFLDDIVSSLLIDPVAI